MRRVVASTAHTRVDRVDVPALVVTGGCDRILPRSWIDHIGELVLQGQVAVIREAGPVPNFNHPRRLAALVRAFVDNVDATGS
jgi:hypothetical protein